MTASRQATTPATCGESLRTETTPVTYASTVAISTIQPSSSAAGTCVPPMSALPPSSDQSMPHGRATTRQHDRADEQSVRDHAQRIRRRRPRRCPGRTGRSSRPGSRPRRARAAGRRRRSSSPAQTSTTQARPPTARTTPTAAARVTGLRWTKRTQPRTSAGAEVFDEQRDADRDPGDRREVAGLYARDGEQPEAGQQRGPAQHQVTVAPGHGQHDERGAGHPQPHHMQRVETRLDQRLGRHT